MADDRPFEFRPGTLRLPELCALWRQPRAIALEPACDAAIEASAQAVASVLSEGRTV